MSAEVGSLLRSQSRCPIFGSGMEGRSCPERAAERLGTYRKQLAHPGLVHVRHHPHSRPDRPRQSKRDHQPTKPGKRRKAIRYPGHDHARADEYHAAGVHLG